MSAHRKLPTVADSKVIQAAEPHLANKDWAARYKVSDYAVRALCKQAGIKLLRPPQWRKGHVGIRFTADHVAHAHSIVSAAAEYLSECLGETVPGAGSDNWGVPVSSRHLQVVVEDINTALEYRRRCVSNHPGFLRKEEI